MRREWLLLIIGVTVGAAAPDTEPPSWPIYYVEERPLQPPTPAGRIVEEPPQKPTRDNAQQAGDNQRGAQKNPALVEIVASPDSQHQAAQNTEQGSQKTSADWWLVKLTGALVLVGAVQAFVFWVQATRLRQTVDVMREIDQRQSADVKASIAVAQRAAEAAELSAKAAIGVELPSLHVENVTHSDLEAGPKSWLLNFRPEIVIKNYGRTPAFVTEVLVNAKCPSGDFTSPMSWLSVAGITA